MCKLAANRLLIRREHEKVSVMTETCYEAEDRFEPATYSLGKAVALPTELLPRDFYEFPDCKCNVFRTTILFCSDCIGETESLS